MPKDLHHLVKGLFRAPWIQEAPRSQGTPKLLSVQIRPPMRLRASRTRTGNPVSLRTLAATSPDIPVPRTRTLGNSPFVSRPLGWMDHMISGLALTCIVS